MVNRGKISKGIRPVSTPAGPKQLACGPRQSMHRLVEETRMKSRLRLRVRLSHSLPDSEANGVRAQTPAPSRPCLSSRPSCPKHSDGGRVCLQCASMSPTPACCGSVLPVRFWLPSEPWPAGVRQTIGWSDEKELPVPAASVGRAVSFPGDTRCSGKTEDERPRGCFFLCLECRPGGLKSR